MRVLLSLANDADHQKALDETGFWGKRGAGSVVFSRATGRFLLAYRSRYVQEPNTWGTWGGAIDPHEEPHHAAARELAEETGQRVHVLGMIPVFVFRHPSGFTYHNFIAVVEEEFVPKLDWETEKYEWFELNDLPPESKQHPGLRSLLHDSRSWNTMRKLAE